MSKKIALITGITGQDGAYLARLLIKKKYIVHGIIRKSSSFNTGRIEKIYEDPFKKKKSLILHYGDLTDFASLNSIISKIKPNEVYNLAAQSHVAVSFANPEYTSDVNALGTLRILESIRQNNLHKTKFYQASTSELFGNPKYKVQNEKTPFYTKSPYGTSKLFAYWMTKNYREAYGIFASNGILFNHESPFRGETFVTKKITKAISKIFKNEQDCLHIGNLDSKRDWGHAKDYVYFQWLILQQKKPMDIVISTNKQYSVRQFINECCKFIGWKIKWSGKGLKEIGYIIENKKKKIIVKVSKKYLRPNELPSLKGNSLFAKKKFNFKLKYSFKDLVKEMMEEDLK
jgi:GDPmannose 4,6-dehydratase